MADADPTRISVSKTIAAPADKIFAIIAHPQGHVDIDGSGMLITATDVEPLTAVGDTFQIHMDRRPLGDIPDMGEYDVQNTVTQFSPDQHLEWTVGQVDRPSVGHVYGYLLSPVGADQTEVTSYCDWSALPEKWRARISWPVVPASALAQSLDNLERIATSS
jgi:hypothetical protein